MALRHRPYLTTISIIVLYWCVTDKWLHSRVSEIWIMHNMIISHTPNCLSPKVSHQLIVLLLEVPMASPLIFSLWKMCTKMNSLTYHDLVATQRHYLGQCWIIAGREFNRITKLFLTKGILKRLQNCGSFVLGLCVNATDWVNACCPDMMLQKNHFLYWL